MSRAGHHVGDDRSPGYRLLESGTAVDFRVVKTEVHEGPEGPDPAEFAVEIELAFPTDSDTGENDLAWGAFGFLFVLGVLSFDDARPPRGFGGPRRAAGRSRATIGTVTHCSVRGLPGARGKVPAFPGRYPVREAVAPASAAARDRQDYGAG